MTTNRKQTYIFFGLVEHASDDPGDSQIGQRSSSVTCVQRLVNNSLAGYLELTRRVEW